MTLPNGPDIKEATQTKVKIHFKPLKSEMKMMKSLSISCKQGYILSKAARIASICEPDDVTVYDLEEKFFTDSFITSFILKACLFGEKDVKEIFKTLHCPVEVAINIHEKVQSGLKQKLLESMYTGERPFNCILCKVERGCCKEGKLLLCCLC